MERKQIKVAFISGPANIAEIYREWSANERQVYFGTDYMKQFLQVAADLDLESRVITWYGDKAGVTQQGNFTFDNRPITSAGGATYHLAMLWWHLKLLPSLIRYRPDILMLTGNQNMWWTLAPVHWLGARIVISYHSVLWPIFRPVSKSWRIFLALNRRLILRHARAILETSQDIRKQILEILGSDRDKVPVLGHLPTYSPVQFATVRPPDFARQPPFRVFFLGRLEANKGIYDIVEIARRLEQEKPGRYRFDICGGGSELAGMRARVTQLGLDGAVSVHGYSSSEKVQELIGASHACIVPTRAVYEAGFEMTCSESILAGRPLITSAVCPAIAVMREATIEVAPDDVDGYHDAIVRLSEDKELYDRLQRACAPLQGQFYDRENSWYSAMRRAIESHVMPDKLAPTAR